MEENFQEKVITERKEKIVKFLKMNTSWIFYLVLVLLIIFGLYLRYLPLADHNPNVPGVQPGLWDITTNDYTLGPDLDPFLFLRYAKEIITTGHIAQNDTLRYVPLGFDTTTELQMVAYFIAITYKLINILGSHSANYAGAFMPVWVFGLTIIAFFLFVRQIFLRKLEDEQERKINYIKSNIISLVSTLFMIVMPGFLSRTVAGIPEKESVAFLFMFLAFYFFLKAWKSEKITQSAIFGVLAGISTGLMGLSWGAVSYVYVSIGIATLAALFLNKLELKEGLVYSLWFVAGTVIMMLFTNRFSIKGFIISLDTGLATLAFGIILVHFILWKTSLHQKINLEKIRLPKSVISVIIAIILGAIAVSLIFGPSFIINKITDLNRILINPIQGRWSTTVAENRQPYLNEWIGNFAMGLFWLFIAGSVLLFKKMTEKIGSRESWILTGLYIFFLFGLIFSRYAPHPNILDGEGGISKFLYYGSALLLIGGFIYYYLKDYRENKNLFHTINYEYLLLFSLFVLCLFTARSAVRLIMVLVPIAPIFFAYLMTETGLSFKRQKEETTKIILMIFAIVLIVLAIYQVYNFYENVKGQSYSFIPNQYTQQWQKAMAWVRNNTPENSVFAHWWDYGYWVQSIGNRATVTDGGNNIVWWNYLTGRLVLTGNNQKDSLEFLWNHKATHFLIDSTDIGKYGAFSQIGSDANYDRLSSGPFAMISDQKQIQETKDGLTRLYNRPVGDGRINVLPIEEDIEYENNNSKIHLFKENSGIIGINIDYKQDNSSISFKQPQAVFISNQQQISLPLRYLYYKGKLKDFGNGIEAVAYPIERLYDSTRGLQLDNLGAVIYLSPRIFKGYLGQVYILNDPLNNFPNFKLVHTEQNYVVEAINTQSGKNLGDFVFYGDIAGPIKIWEIKYSGTEKYNEEYLRTTPPSYITWKF